jgi:hypothetical protein
MNERGSHKRRSLSDFKSKTSKFEHEINVMSSRAVLHIGKPFCMSGRNSKMCSNDYLNSCPVSSMRQLAAVRVNKNSNFVYSEIIKPFRI